MNNQTTRIRVADVKDSTGFFMLADSPFASILVGIVISLAVSAALYFAFHPLAEYVTGSAQWGVILGMFLSAGSFFLILSVPGIQEGKPQHHRVLKLFGDYIELCLPAGHTWVPTFCNTKEVNIGEQMIDMRDTEVFIRSNRKAILHLQMQVKVCSSYKYALAGASLEMPLKPVYNDPVIEAVVSRIKESVRLVCEAFEEYDDLNEPSSKQRVVESVTTNDELRRIVREWGVEILDLFVRTVILPDSVVAAANLPEIEKREREAETFDVETMLSISKRIKEEYPALDDKDRLEAAQIQQKRLPGIAVRGRGLALIDERKGDK